MRCPAIAGSRALPVAACADVFATGNGISVAPVVDCSVVHLFATRSVGKLLVQLAQELSMHSCEDFGGRCMAPV